MSFDETFKSINHIWQEISIIVVVHAVAIGLGIYAHLIPSRLITQGVNKLRFLRSIPIDPMTKNKEWGLRSMQDDPDSDSWGGQSVFDVYTKSEGAGLDGTKYKDW